MGNEKSRKKYLENNETYVCNDCGDILQVVPAGKEVITLTSVGGRDEGRFLTEIKRVPSYNS